MAKRQQKQSEEQHLKSEEALHFSEERMQLLETVRQMIDSEFERREREIRHSVHHENPPSYRCLWQRLVERGKGQGARGKR